MTSIMIGAIGNSVLGRREETKDTNVRIINPTVIVDLCIVKIGRYTCTDKAYV